MSKWIAEFELEDGDTMPEHMDLNYMGAMIDFHCRPLEQEPCEDCISRQAAIDAIYDNDYKKDMRRAIEELPSVNPQEPKTDRIEYGNGGNPYKLTISIVDKIEEIIKEVSK